jgi:integrase
MTRAEALAALDAVVTPINARQDGPSNRWAFGDFARQVYFPFYRRKWKGSTAATNEDRVKHHLTCEFAGRTLNSFTRDGLQSYLDLRAAAGLSLSTIAHLRWDLKQIFNMAVADGYLERNPAALLFIPRQAHRPARRRMTAEEVRILFSSIELRELLIAKLAIVAGMRPGEIFGLQWGHVKGDHVEVKQRIYRGVVDSPKNDRSERQVALSEGVATLMAEWKSMAADSSPGAWVFPSEKMRTPLSKDNCWRRWIAPRLKSVGLEWVNFQVMRRTPCDLVQGNKIDPKVDADQLGHSVDVNLNVYAQTPLHLRKEAVNALEAAIRGSGSAGHVM